MRLSVLSVCLPLGACVAYCLLAWFLVAFQSVV